MADTRPMVNVYLDASREAIVELAVLEHEQGVPAVFDRVFSQSKRSEND